MLKLEKELHKNREGKNSEIQIDDIKLDKVTDIYVVEVKKSDSDILSTELQLKYYLYVLKYYLYVLKSKGCIKKGKIKFLNTYKQDKKEIIIEYNNLVEKEVLEMISEIENFLVTEYPPLPKLRTECKKCAYYEYCYI